MNWPQLKLSLENIGVFGIESEEHLYNFLEWECDDKQLEKRIKQAIEWNSLKSPEYSPLQYSQCSFSG